MNRLKTNQEVQKELETVKKEIATLQQNKQTQLNMLAQFQRHGVTHSYPTWFVNGNTLSTRNQ